MPLSKRDKIQKSFSQNFTKHSIITQCAADSDFGDTSTSVLRSYRSPFHTLRRLLGLPCRHPKKNHYLIPNCLKHYRNGPE